MIVLKGCKELKKGEKRRPFLSLVVINQHMGKAQFNEWIVLKTLALFSSVKV